MDKQYSALVKSYKGSTYYITYMCRSKQEFTTTLAAEGYQLLTIADGRVKNEAHKRVARMFYELKVAREQLMTATSLEAYDETLRWWMTHFYIMKYHGEIWETQYSYMLKKLFATRCELNIWPSASFNSFGMHVSRRYNGRYAQLRTHV